MRELRSGCAGIGPEGWEPRTVRLVSGAVADVVSGPELEGHGVPLVGEDQAAWCSL